MRDPVVLFNVAKWNSREAHRLERRGDTGGAARCRKQAKSLFNEVKKIRRAS